MKRAAILLGLMTMVGAPAWAADRTSTLATFRQSKLTTLVERNGYVAEVARTKPTDRREIACLALNIYHEGRGSTRADRLAIGFVTINRLQQKWWPKSVCDVVWEKAQFSWTTAPPKSLVPLESDAWAAAQRDAYRLYYEHEHMRDPTNGATHFYVYEQVVPEWDKDGRGKQTIGSHRYMKLVYFME